MFLFGIFLLQIELYPCWIHINILKLPETNIIIMVIHSTCFWLWIYHNSTFHCNFLTFLYKSSFFFICNSKIILVIFSLYIIILYNWLFFSEWVPRFLTESLILSIYTAWWILCQLSYYISLRKRFGNTFSFFKVNLIAFWKLSKINLIRSEW